MPIILLLLRAREFYLLSHSMLYLFCGIFDRLFSQKEIDKGNLMNWDSQVIDSEIPLTLGRVSDRKP